MASTYYKANFICSKDENHIDKFYIWSDSEETHHCKVDGCDGTLIEFDASSSESFKINKLKARPKAEGKKRSLDNFKKEIFPTLPKREKAMFAKKNGWKH